MARPKLNNNPFALRIAKQERNGRPWSYKGQVGKAPDGFLAFDSPAHGVRAGFVNLFQTYYLKGFDTIEKIFDSNRSFPVYGDAGKGDLYIKNVSDWTGLDRDYRLKVADVYQVGRAIERMENGKKWVEPKDFDEGWAMAKSYLKL